MDNDIFLDLLSGPARLRRRASPISGDLRISWGVAVVVLILGSSRGAKCSFQKLHFLGHAARLPQTRDHALSLLQPGPKPRFPLMRVEPWLNRAVNFAAALELAAITGGRSIQMQPAGQELLQKLVSSELLEDEKRFLTDIRPFATEKNIENAMTPGKFL